MQTQWRNTNSYRKYPFSDGCSMLASSGFRLPDDVFVDAMVCLVAPAGKVWLSLIDIPAGVVQVSDSTGVRATADAAAIAVAFSTSQLKLYDSYGRYAGSMITGTGFSGVGGTNVFPSSATEFAPACLTDVPASGVEGFLLPDGTYVGGDVLFEGIDGIRITSEMLGPPVVTLDALGVNTPPSCVTLPNPITCIKVNVASSAQAGAGLTISRVDNTIYIGHRAALADVCDSNGRLPDSSGTLPTDPGDPCSILPSSSCAPNPPWSSDGPCPSAHPDWYIVPGSDLVELVPAPGVPMDAATLSQYIGTSNPAPKSAQGMILNLRGVPNSVRTD